MLTDSLADLDPQQFKDPPMYDEISTTGLRLWYMNSVRPSVMLRYCIETV